MEIFKGKIEAKCLNSTNLSVSGVATIDNLGVTNIGVTGNSYFHNNVVFNDDVNFYAPITAVNISVDQISITSANIDMLGVSTINVDILNVTGMNILSAITFGDLNTECIDAEKINAGLLTADNTVLNNLSVTGPSNFYGPTDYYGNVTFHGLVFGISGGSGSNGDIINGVSGFVLEVDGDVNIANDLTVQGELIANIGTPTNDMSERPIDISTTTFTNTIGINLGSTMKIADGFQIIDHYFKTYFLCPPPGVSLVGCTSTSQDLSIEWENFPKIEYAPLDIYLPHVIENRIDYVESTLNPSQDWSHPSTVTIATTSRNSNKVIFHTQGSGSSLISNTWNQYTIMSGVSYDIRIYGINYHSGEPTYLKIFGKSTSSIGVPIEPTSLFASGASTSSLSTSWTKPIDHDNITIGNNTFPIIERYAVNYNAISSTRYPTFIGSSGTQYTSLTVNPTNSSTNLTITGLNPGTVYDVNVQGKNAINSSYGLQSIGTTGTTNLPNKPPLLAISDANTLNNLSTLRSPYLSNGGYSLDGQTVISPIIRYANVNDSTQPIRTTTTPNVRNNEISGTTILNTATLYAYGGLDADYPTNDVVSENIDGFSHASNVGNYNGTKVRLVINTDDDYYSSPSNGFYKSFTMYAQGLTSSAYYPASTDKYVLRLRYQNLESGGSDITTNKVNFYVDNLNTNPSLSGVYITEEIVGVSASTQISGVPTYKNNAIFRFQFTMSEIANYFLRHDRKHAEAFIETSSNIALSSILTIQKISNTVSTGNVDGTTHQYFEEPVNLHQRSTVLHNTSGQILTTNPNNIQLHTFTIPLTSAANSKFDENFRVQVDPYNLFTANSSGSSATGIYANPLNISLTESKLRIDTKSIENDRSGSNTTTTEGRHVQSGLGTYPTLGTTQSGQCGGDYDHTQSILSGISGNYAEELQLVNGKYSTPSTGDGYKNYNATSPNNFYFPTAYTFYDYSTISSGVTTVRYTTFKYSGVIPSGETRERLRITINGMSGLTVNFTQFDQANHQLWLRVVDIGDGSNLELHTTTEGWLDCTNTVGQNGILTGINGTRCINGGTSTSTQRDCFIRPGTTEDAVIFIRIGMPQNLNASITSITCTSVSTF